MFSLKLFKFQNMNDHEVYIGTIILNATFLERFFKSNVILDS